MLESDIFYAIYVSGLTFLYFFYSLYFIHYFHSIVTHYIWDLYISAYNIHANINLCMIIHYVVKGFFCKWEWERTKHIEWNKMHINTKIKNRRKKYNMYTNLYLIALTLEIFKFVIIIYTNNIIDIIFSMYTYIFFYGKEERGGWLDNYCHALKRVYQGFLILKIKFLFKNIIHFVNK